MTAQLSAEDWASVRPSAGPRSRVAQLAGVQKSGDLVRIMELPRRMLDLDAVPDLTDLFRRPGGTMRLRPIQSAALLEAEAAGGLVGAIGVGHGKTLTMLLMPRALGARRAVFLVPADLKRQLVERDIPTYSQHFDLQLERVAGILSYTDLERPALGVGQLPRAWKWLAYLSAAIASPLEALDPDLAVCDEGHCLAGSSARAKRYRRCADDRPDLVHVVLSGSLTTLPIERLAPIARYALGRRSPLPLSSASAAEWSESLDGDEPSKSPGALVLLQRDADEPVREAVRRRLAETPGWVATRGQSYGGSLVLRVRRVEPGRAAAEALAALRRDWAIDGEELQDATEMYRVARQLACGFRYRWAWPGGVRDEEWVEAGRAWRREVRGRLRARSRQGEDTPGLLQRAAEQGRWRSEAWPAWAAVKDRWTPEPPREAVWFADHVVREVVRWGKRAKAGICWYRHRAVGAAIGCATGWPVYGEGTDAGTADVRRTPLIACSIDAQRRGKNLQAWSRNLVVSPPAGAELWEQLLGRTHRAGQAAGEVECEVLVCAREDEQALEHARTVARERAREVHGQEPLLLLANVVDEAS